MRIAVTATPGCPPTAPFLLRGDIPGAFRTAAESGCDGVELHLRRASDVEAGAVKRLMEEYGQEVPTLGTGMGAGLDGLTFTDPDPEIRARAVARVCGHVDLASELGAAVIIGLIAGKLGAGEEGARRDRRGAALACLGQVCRAAEPRGVTVLLEPLNRYESDYINTLADAATVADEVAAGNLKILADTFHMNIEEPRMEASLRAAGGRLGHVHLADTNRQAPGHGHLDVRCILGTLETLGYRGYLALEILPLPDPMRALADSLSAVRP